MSTLLRDTSSQPYDVRRRMAAMLEASGPARPQGLLILKTPKVVVAAPTTQGRGSRARMIVGTMAGGGQADVASGPALNLI